MKASKPAAVPYSQASFEFADLDGETVAPIRSRGAPRKSPEPRPGDRFGQLLIVECQYTGHGAVAHVRAKCDCGSEPYWVTGKQFSARGGQKNCKDCRTEKRTGKPRANKGDRRGLLTVLECVYGDRGGVAEVKVQCDCGSEPYRLAGDVYARATENSGCMGCIGERQIKHPRPKAGERIGNFTVLGYVKVPDKRAKQVVVQCDCGSTPLTKPPLELRRARFNRCNACVLNMPYGKQPEPGSEPNIRPFARKTAIPKVGDVFGERTVIEVVRGPLGGFKYMRVRCSCDAKALKVEDIPRFLQRKQTACRSCARGRVVNKRLREAGFTELTTKSPDYLRIRGVIDGAVNRCTNPKSQAWKNYGGRHGNPIKVHAPWVKDRIAFVIYVASLPGWDILGHELDRIDNNGNYEPGNLRFTTSKINCNNRRTIGSLTAENAELKARIRELGSA
jgi:hypothetical protein